MDTNVRGNLYGEVVRQLFCLCGSLHERMEDVQTTKRNEASWSSASNCSTGFDIFGDLAVIVVKGAD